MKRSLSVLLLLSACATPPPTLAPEALSKPLDAKRPELLTCYKTGLASVTSDSKPHGKVRIRFAIDPEGHPRDAKIAQSELDHSGIEECLLGVVRATSFAPTGAHDEIVVYYPLEFKL